MTCWVVSLQAELVRIAVEMEASMLAKLGPSGSTSPRMMSPADRQVGMSTRSPLLQHGREVWLARMKNNILLWLRSSSTIRDYGGCEGVSVLLPCTVPCASQPRVCRPLWSRWPGTTCCCGNAFSASEDRLALLAWKPAWQLLVQTLQPSPHHPAHR